ncbi:MAG TPA: hypothetical protein VLV54_16765 [Thermoanaerobaculia bacterium]|nr:hypothetical protein [Thermoanaerobaculia bacterium]
MSQKLAPATLLLSVFLSLPAAAEIQYFGYVGGADDDSGLNLTHGFANFAHVSSSSDLASPFVLNRVNALSQKGLKATVDLGLVLWCDYDGTGSYRSLCWDWLQRWEIWKEVNAEILTPDKVIAFAILDEPFNRGAIMTDFEAAAQKVKADLPWARTWLVDSTCVVAGTCSSLWLSPGLTGYQGNLPGIDWLGVDAYAIHPQTDATYRSAVSILKARFPGRPWIYVMDGYWETNLHGPALASMSEMGPIADEWYEEARNDPDAVLLGVFLWPATPGWTTSEQFSCDVLAHHVVIGREITHKARPQTALPIGSFSIDNNGVVSGWACDPDGTLCEAPRVDLYSNGTFYASTSYAPSQDFISAPQCGTGIAYRFKGNAVSGARISAVAQDLDSGSANLASTCGDCVWYSQLYAPKGCLDSVDANGYATGWVCDQDSALTSSQVRIVAGGTTVGLYTTNLGNEPTVTDKCGGGGMHRFRVQLPASARGKQINAYAENLGSPAMSREVQIPTLCRKGRCVWR